MWEEANQTNSPPHKIYKPNDRISSNQTTLRQRYLLNIKLKTISTHLLSNNFNFAAWGLCSFSFIFLSRNFLLKYRLSKLH